MSKLFVDPTRDYPDLVKALQAMGQLATSRESERSRTRQTLFYTVAFLAGFSLIVLQGRSSFDVITTIVVSLSVGLGFDGWYRTRRRSRQAAELALRMTEMIAKRRLHRDIDEPSLVVLNECSRQWFRAREALECSVWKVRGLPMDYQQTRDTALAIATDAMHRALLEFRDRVPEVVPGRQASDFAEELDENLRGNANEKPKPSPVYFAPRAIAKHLYALADEAEHLVDRIKDEPKSLAKNHMRKGLLKATANLKAVWESPPISRYNASS